FLGAAMVKNDSLGQSAIYNQSEGLSLYEIMKDVWSDTTCYGNFLNGQPANAIDFSQYHVSGTYPHASISTGDSAVFGNCTMLFDSVTADFNNLANTWDDVSDITGDTLEVGDDPAVSCGFIAYAHDAGVRILKFHIVCPPVTFFCDDPLEEKINPYYA